MLLLRHSGKGLPKGHSRATLTYVSAQGTRLYAAILMMKMVKVGAVTLISVMKNSVGV